MLKAEVAQVAAMRMASHRQGPGVRHKGDASAVPPATEGFFLLAPGWASIAVSRA